MVSRLMIRPVMSRRLRAALLLLTALALLALSQTSLPDWGIGLASISVLLGMIYIGWRLPQSVVPFVLSYKPLQLHLCGEDGQTRPAHCVALSVYAWLVILRYRDSQVITSSPDKMIVLLPDSLTSGNRHQWRQIMVWARLMRRAIGGQKNLD
jgi:hypothetical protein